MAAFASLCFDLGNGDFSAGIVSTLNYLVIFGFGLMILAAMAAGLALFFAGMGTLGLMIGYAAGYAASILFSLFCVRDLPASEDAALPKMDFSKDFWILCGYSIYLALTLSVDGLMAKHYFSAHEAGLYMASATLARMMFIVLNPIQSVNFSHMCHAAGDKQRMKSLLAHALVLTLGICVLGTGAAFVLSGIIISITYGKDFSESALLLPFSILALTPVAAMLSLANYWLAQKQNRFVAGLLLGNALQLGLILMRHSTLLELIQSYGFGALLQCALAAGFASFTPATSEGLKADGRQPII